MSEQVILTQKIHFESTSCRVASSVERNISHMVSSPQQGLTWSVASLLLYSHHTHIVTEPGFIPRHHSTAVPSNDPQVSRAVVYVRRQLWPISNRGGNGLVTVYSLTQYNMLDKQHLMQSRVLHVMLVSIRQFISFLAILAWFLFIFFFWISLKAELNQQVLYQGNKSCNAILIWNWAALESHLVYS